MYSRVHSHGGEFGVEVFDGQITGVAGEGLGGVELMSAAELKRG